MYEEQVLPRIDQLQRTVPLASLLRCRLMRSQLNGKQTCLDLYEENDDDGLEDELEDELGPWLMRAIHSRDALGRHTYTIYLPPNQHDLQANRDFGEPVGRVTSNTMGSTFWIYERANESEKGDQHQWQETCVVLYKVSLLGKRGPRTMKVIVRAVDKDGKVMNSPLDSQPLLERYKRRETDTHLIILENKRPQWSAEIGSFVLDFFNRMLMPSVKNFHLVHPEDVDYTVVQFGKGSPNMFTLDIRYPLNPIVALGIAISSIQHKLACP
ncbi:Tubby- protein 2 [Coemansia brasiliensis]|uniref:Tubby- protein 2 n=1 Tax=Coemansia brasiliensis TaxID=2650707 RepID=A0A9W8M0P3_9FUNG|nr:Tubby- protein 2 [Coemansia brasiliensis]